MMKCKEYVFLLSSGKMAESPAATRLAGAVHKLTCRHCRAFTSNDEALSRIIGEMKRRVERPRGED
ncbi:MAG: hypothetical protein QM749_09860 [Aquabacterium sp.]